MRFPQEIFIFHGGEEKFDNGIKTLASVTSITPIMER
jgi:hypothetical protein